MNLSEHRPTKRSTLWGGRTRRVHASIEGLAREAADSLWFVQLDGMNGLHLSHAEARLFTRDEAIRVMQHPNVARWKPVAVAGEPLLSWGGSTFARIHASIEGLVREAADSLWYLQLDGMCRFWLTVDGGFHLSHAEARLFTRDEAIGVMQHPNVAHWKPVAVAAEPLLQAMRAVLNRASRPDMLTVLRIEVAKLTEANDRLARELLIAAQAQRAQVRDLDHMGAFEGAEDDA